MNILKPAWALVVSAALAWGEPPAAAFCPRPTAAPNAELQVVGALIAAALAEPRSCARPEEAARLATTDAQVWAWFSLKGAQAGDQLRVDWVSPGGQPHDSVFWNSLDQGGDFCFWASLEIAGKAAERLPGPWQAQLYANGVFLYALSFEIRRPGVETAFLSAREPAGCDASAGRETLPLRGEAVWAAAHFLRPAGAGRLRFEWLARDGRTLWSQTTPTPDQPARQCHLARIPLAGGHAVAGDFRMRVSLDEEVLAVVPGRLAPLEWLDGRVSATRPEGCEAPQDLRKYVPADRDVWAWLKFRTLAGGGTLKLEWVDPGGQVREQRPVDVAGGAEPACYAASLPIPAGLSGWWQARAYFDGVFAGALDFSVTPALVDEAMLTKETAGCARPLPAAGVRQSDPQAVAWFALRALRTGMKPVVEWFDVAGRRAVMTELPPRADGSDGCVSARLPLAGLSAGQWRARLSVDGEYASEIGFMIGPAVFDSPAMTAANPGCRAPAGKSRFTAADAPAVLWFRVEEVRAGDVALIEWVGPDAGVAQTMTWTMNAAGSYYLTANLALAGRAVGAWKARVKWNGEAAFAVPFELAPAGIR